MTCRECADFLSDYLAGDLSVEVRATFERHLSLCPNCAIYLDQFRATVKAGKHAYEAAETAEMPEELVRAILAARRQ